MGDVHPSIFGPVIPQEEESAAFTPSELVRIRARRVEADAPRAEPAWPKERRFATMYPAPSRAACPPSKTRIRVEAEAAGSSRR